MVRDERPDAVVVLIGGNERNDMTVKGGPSCRAPPSGETEYERRARVVMRAIMSEGVERVFWSGPPTARDPQWNSTYADVNDALSRAADAVPGVQYVDLYDESEPFATEGDDRRPAGDRVSVTASIGHTGELRHPPVKRCERSKWFMVM